RWGAGSRSRCTSRRRRAAPGGGTRCYDKADRLTSCGAPDSITATFHYDAVANASSSTTSYSYDAAHRLTGVHNRTNSGATIDDHDYTTLERFSYARGGGFPGHRRGHYPGHVRHPEQVSGRPRKR